MQLYVVDGLSQQHSLSVDPKWQYVQVYEVEQEQDASQSGQHHPGPG
jgi:hypothetical protein